MFHRVLEVQLDNVNENVQEPLVPSVMEEDENDPEAVMERALLMLEEKYARTCGKLCIGMTEILILVNASTSRDAMWRTIFIAGRFTGRQINLALMGLRRDFPEMPKDRRTFMKTPTEQVIKIMSNGVYGHVDLKPQLINKLCKPQYANATELLLFVNADGFPVSQKGAYKIWAISCCISKPSPSSALLMGAFEGTSMPLSAHEFYADARRDLHEVTSLGLLHPLSNRTVTVKVKFVMDGQARWFTMMTQPASGRFACERCHVVGYQVNHRMVFIGREAARRTDADFRTKDGDGHNNEVGPMEMLAVDTIYDVVLEPMHFWFLGVVRIYLRLILTTLTPMQREQLHGLLAQFGSHMPAAFQRHMTNNIPIPSYKATEYRQIVLYVGIVAFRDILSPAKYRHFLTLMCATYILCSEDLCTSTQFLEIAQQCITKFLDGLMSIFGEEAFVWSIHMCCHVVAEVEKNGPLDSFSANIFETFNRILKSHLHGSRNHVEELLNRYDERMTAGMEEFDSMTADYERLLGKQGLDKYPHRAHYGGGLFSDKPPNCFALINNAPAQILECHADYIIYQRFLYTRPAFTFPLDSTIFNIFYCREFYPPLQISPSHIQRQCIGFPVGEEILIVPMLHANN